jgi:hypothetical protein
MRFLRSTSSSCLRDVLEATSGDEILYVRPDAVFTGVKPSLAASAASPGVLPRCSCTCHWQCPYLAFN